RGRELVRALLDRVVDRHADGQALGRDLVAEELLRERRRFQLPEFIAGVLEAPAEEREPLAELLGVAALQRRCEHLPDPLTGGFGITRRELSRFIGLLPREREQPERGGRDQDRPTRHAKAEERRAGLAD